MKLTYKFEENEEVTDAQILASVKSSRSAVCVTASTQQKSTKKNKKSGVSSASKTAASSKEIALGDKVRFKGGPHYSNSMATTYQSKPKAGPAKVTGISKKAKHPYHVIHTDKTSSVYGWVDASLIEK